MVTTRKRHKQQFRKGDGKSTEFRDWAGLQQGLVDDISRRLPVVSVISMGNVCQSWRTALVETASTRQGGLPWLMPCGQNDSKVRTCLSILENKRWMLEVPEALGGYCWGSIKDWLIIVKRCADMNDVFFLNPFSRTKLLLPQMQDQYKMVLSTSPTEPNCVALVLGCLGTVVSFWTPGAKIWHEKYVGLGSYEVDDAVFCGGYFYFVTHHYDIMIIKAKRVISSIKKCEDGRSDYFRLKREYYRVVMPERLTPACVRSYLVESCGEVLLVCRLFSPFEDEFRVTTTFEVFKLDTHEMTWIKLESLGDRVLFIGECGSRSFSWKELGDYMANCIVFFRADEQSSIHSELRGDESLHIPSSFKDWGVFSLERNCFIPSSSNHGKRFHWPPIMITAPLWWYFRGNNSQNYRNTNAIKSVRHLF